MADLLLEDFPEVVDPIQCLDGIANRCNGQLYKGERTHIGWTAREGCAVAASMQGAVLPGTSVAPVAKRSRVSFADLQRNRRG